MKKIQSLINWDNTVSVFNQDDKITPKIPNRYIDNEIDGKVPSNYFDLIFQNFDEFQSSKYRQTFKLFT